MAFPPSFLEEIRNRLSLAAVIGRRVRLIRKGREWSGLCPFHNEKTPSFTVNEDKGFFHCFGCGAHGDVIGFEMRAGNLSFPEAIERLAAEAGLEVPQQSREERERESRRATLHSALETAARFYEGELRKPGGQAGLDYLRRRGLDDAAIARFRLGYAPDSRQALRRALAAEGVSDELAIEAGLLIRPDSGEPYDRFRGRVMFPIADARGRIIAFGGRTLGDGEPKYLNSPETPLFHKGEVLYGLALAREAAGKAGTIVVCEGYMDVIAMHRAGFAHAVAPLGTALTEAQIGVLWRVAPCPVICLDGDNAGLKAAARAAERALPLLKPGLSLAFAFVPPPEDPDSLLRTRGPQAMAEVLDRARPLADIVWEWAAAGRVATPEGRAAIEGFLVEAIRDPAVRGEYVRDFRRRLYEHGRRAIVGGRPTRPGARRHGAVGRGPDGRLPGLALPPPPAPSAPRQERLILAALINHPDCLEPCAERLGLADFADPALDELRQLLVERAAEWSGLGSDELRCRLSDAGFVAVLAELPDAAAPERFIRPDTAKEAVRLALARLLARRIDGGDETLHAEADESAELAMRDGDL